MSNPLKEKYAELAKTLPLFGAAFSVYDVTTINHKPHPFMIGSGHVAYASDHCGGRLSTDAIEASHIGCYATEGHRGRCNKPPSAHTSDRVLLIQQLRNLTNDEATAALKEVVATFEADKIDGVVLVDTPEKYRITKDEVPDVEEVRPAAAD